MLPFDSEILPFQQGVYVVGGSVRDFLLDTSPLDYDLAVDGDARAFATHLASACNGRLVILGKDDKAVFRVVKDPYTFDIVPLFGKNLIEDLQRRDFTINAMAFDLTTQAVIDPFDARHDLDAGIIKAVSDRIFQDDPLRLLRAYRIAAALNFKLSPNTRLAIKQFTRQINTSAGERVQAELTKLLATPHSHAYLSQMAEDGLLGAMIPEFSALDGCLQNEYHQFDVLEHTFAAYGHLEMILNNPENLLPQFASRLQSHFDADRAVNLKLALLLHDIGKPACKTIDQDNRIHFYGHGRKSAEMAVCIMHRLRMSRRAIHYIDVIIRNHLRALFLFVASQKKDLKPKGLVRFFVRCGPRAPDILIHTIADIMGKGRASTPRDHEFIRFAKELLGIYFNAYATQASRPPLITGHDLIKKLDMQPAPAFKVILRRVEEARLAGHIHTKKEALALARTIGSQSRGSLEA